MCATLCLVVVFVSVLRNLCQFVTSLPVLVAVFLCSGSEGQDTPGYRPDSPDSLSRVSGLLPGVSGSCCQTHILLCGYYVICITHVFALTYSPHCKRYKGLCGSLVYYFFLPFLMFVKSNLKSKFMAYIQGELLYASCSSLYGYQMSYMWVVINHQKRRRLKVIQAPKWVLVNNDKTHVHLIV